MKLWIFWGLISKSFWKVVKKTQSHPIFLPSTHSSFSGHFVTFVTISSDFWSFWVPFFHFPRRFRRRTYLLDRNWVALICFFFAWSLGSFWDLWNWKLDFFRHFKHWKKLVLIFGIFFLYLKLLYLMFELSLPRTLRHTITLLLQNLRKSTANKFKFTSESPFPYFLPHKTKPTQILIYQNNCKKYKLWEEKHILLLKKKQIFLHVCGVLVCFIVPQITHWGSGGMRVNCGTSQRENKGESLLEVQILFVFSSSPCFRLFQRKGGSFLTLVFKSKMFLLWNSFPLILLAFIFYQTSKLPPPLSNYHPTL